MNGKSGFILTFSSLPKILINIYDWLKFNCNSSFISWKSSMSIIVPFSYSLPLFFSFPPYRWCEVHTIAEGLTSFRIDVNFLFSLQMPFALQKLNEKQIQIHNLMDDFKIYNERKLIWIILNNEKRAQLMICNSRVVKLLVVIDIFIFIFFQCII